MMCFAVGEATNNQLFLLPWLMSAISQNLINLLPIATPRRGPLVMVTMAPWMWFVGFASLIQWRSSSAAPWCS